MKDISALQSIIFLVPVPKCFISSSQLHCGRPGGDSKIPVMPPTEIQEDSYITYMLTFVILG